MRLWPCVLHLITDFINSDKVVHVEILLITNVGVSRNKVICNILLNLDGDKRNQS